MPWGVLGYGLPDGVQGSTSRGFARLSPRSIREVCFQGPSAWRLDCTHDVNTLAALYVCWVCLASKNKALKRDENRLTSLRRAPVSTPTLLSTSEKRESSKKRPAGVLLLGIKALENSPGRHRPRHSRMSLTARQSRPALDVAIYRPDSTLYQLQPSFHTSSTEPEPTARARRAGEEFY